MAATKKCAPATVRKLKRESKAAEKKLGAGATILSEDWALKRIRELDPDRVMSWCAGTAAFVTRHAQHERMIRGNDMVAVDVTGNGHHGRGLKDETLKTKPKNGTSGFLSYLVSVQ